MIKCFLSHSSRDKAGYVRTVAKLIRKEATIFDEETFEEGMTAIEEIARGLDESTLFVIFLSNAALNSSWVKNELNQAKELFDSSQIERIYPIIIESGIDHNDSRIPEWMRESINIQPIMKPTIAARKINSRLTELSWKFHPRLKERQEIFVGRNDHIKNIEERLDDFRQPTPIVLISSGLPSIGRKTLLQHAMRKANLVRDSYDFPIVSLSQFDGIEDFILKIYDLGFVSVENHSVRLAGTFKSKIELAIEIVAQLAHEKERIIVEDRGVLVQSNGEIVDWFSEVISAISINEYLIFGIASQFRVNPAVNRINPSFYAVAVSEMERPERDGLLNRYSKFENVSLNKDDYLFLSDLLTGYPEQVLYAVDLVRDHGIFKARQQSHTIQQYGSDKAKVVLDAFKDDKDVLDFIYFLSRFEFISYDVLFDIVSEEEYFPKLEKLLSSSVCERIGASADYVRVNEVIRDYISRNRFGLTNMFEDAIKKHVSSFLERYEDDNYDISDYIFSVQESLRSGNGIPDEIIVPSVFVKTIKTLYDERNYKEALMLAQRVLHKEQYLHKNTIDHIRFILCQCLARLRDSHFFTEVRNISEPDRSFLHGFYYRLAGQHTKAEEYLNRVLEVNGRRDPRVIGELVLVYMQNEEYSLAYDLAKENYYSRSGNPINANNYFACLIRKDKTPENRKELESIIERLSIDKSDRAQEMLDSARARLMAYYEGNETGSMALLEEAIAKFPEVNYPLLTKAELSLFFRNMDGLKEAIDKLEKMTVRNAQTFRTFIKYKAMYLAMSGDSYQAKQLVTKELKGYFGRSLQKLVERLESLAMK